MNTSEERDLIRALHGQADAVQGAHVSFNDVTGRAESVVRRRRIVASAGVLAAAAVVVPTMFLMNGGLPQSERPPVTDTSPSPSVPLDPNSMDFSNLPTGAKPAIAYVSNGPIVTPQGEEIDIASDFSFVSAIAQLSDGRWIATGINTGNPAVEVVELDGSAAFYDGGFGLTVSSSGDIAATLDESGTVRTFQADVETPADLPPVQGYSPKFGAISGADCTEGGGQSSCSVFVNTWTDNGPQSELVTPAGSVVQTSHGLKSVADATQDQMLIGLTKVTDDGSCSGLVPPNADKPLWRTCDHTLKAFSPTGDFVLAGPAYLDGIGDGQIAIYDASGGLVFDRLRDEGGAIINEAVWEDSGSVLAEVWQNGFWSIVRLNTDTTVEYAVEPIPGDVENSPYVLETRKRTPEEASEDADPPEPPANAVDLSTLTQGDSPRLGYATSDELIHPTGEKMTLPVRTIEFAPMGDGWITLETRLDDVDRESLTIARLTAINSNSSESIEFDNAPTGKFAVSPTRTAVGWSRSDGSVWVARSSTDVVKLKGASRGKDAELQEVDSCLPEGQCGIFVAEDFPAGRGVSYRLTGGTGGDVSIRDFSGITSYSPGPNGSGRVSGSTGFTGSAEFPCTAVRDIASQQPVLEWCDPDAESPSVYGDLAPDGQHVIDAYFEGFGAGSLKIVDLDSGEVVSNLDVVTGQGGITDAAWEDSEHLLAVVSQDNQWAIVRVGIDGTVELATKVVKGEWDSPEFRLQAH